MIAFAHDHVENAQDRFVAMLPAIKQIAQHAFRGQQPEAQAELVQETIANAYVAFARLVQLGKVDLAFATPLAHYAVRQIRSGRRVGTNLNVHDVSSQYAQVSKGIVVERLDRFNHGAGEWQEVLVEDKHSGPAATAAARIDVAAWFRSLGRQKRRIARLLARGETTSSVAQTSGLSLGRISQLRRELHESWLTMHGELQTA